MDLSVIIINYNRGFYLQYLLKYFWRYKNDAVEIILIDDCSTEQETIYMLAHLDELFPQHSFKLVQNKTNQGIGYNRQLGLTLAKGKYVVYIDSDDSIVDAYLPTLLNLIQTEKDVYCFSAITYPLGDIHNEWSYVWNKMYKKYFLTSNNIKFELERNGEDVIFNEQVLLNSPSLEYYTTTFLYIQNLTGNSLTRSGKGWL